MYDKIQHHSLDSFRYSAIFSNASEIMSGEFGAANCCSITMGVSTL